MVLVARRFLLLILAFSALARAQEPSPFAIDIPKWFSESFLDFREEVRDAAAGGKRVMIYFGQDGCPYCKALMEANFSQKDIVEATRNRFVAIAVNLWGDRETVWLDGKARSEKELGAFLRVQFTPTLLFLDETGGVALRLNGYQPPARFRLALEFAGSKRPGDESSFAAFVRERPGAASRKAVVDEALFERAPHRLAAASDRPLAVLFESRDCDACAELHEALRRPEVRSLAARLRAVRLDAFGKASVEGPDGATVTEAALARSLGVSFTPTLVFFEAGREVFRVEGYVRAFHLASALDYVASGAWRTEPSFQRFVQLRADKARAGGSAVQLW